MFIFPAIDLYAGKAVRLYKGDYAQMTVYSENPLDVAKDFEACGTSHLHMVDLEGARDGTTPNLATVLNIKANTSLFCEIGGGVRNMEIVDRYMDAGLDRVILGTAAVTDPAFAEAAAKKYPGRIAVGVDLKDGIVAVKGWTEKSSETALAFCKKMQSIGIETLICTDISRDGAMQGTNVELYKALSGKLNMQIIASGGVSSMEDVRALKTLGIYGAIVGKAYYTGMVDLRKAIEEAK